MLKTIIVDDVKAVRENIADLLKDFCFSSVTVIAEADSVKSGVEQIIKHKPDLVFLDVEMPDGTGFDLLKKLSGNKIKVIFVTAYDHYSIKAIKYSAIDYLLKPIDIDELKVAVEKAKELIEKENWELKFNALFSNIDSIKSVPTKLILKTSENIHSVNIDDIIRCEADNNYTSFYLLNGKKILVSTTIKEYEDILVDTNFFRVHQSHLINLNHFDYFKKNDGGFVVMKDNSTVPVSTRKRTQLLQLIEKM